MVKSFERIQTIETKRRRSIEISCTKTIARTRTYEIKVMNKINRFFPQKIVSCFVLIRYLAAEENEIMKNDHKQLENIKGELDRLREISTTPTILTGGGGSGGGGSDGSHSTSNYIDENEHVDQQLGVLIEHRDTLLQTGTYTHNDALIQELERRIQEAMKRKSSSSNRH